MNILVQTIDGIQEVLAICPCSGCGEIFRLVEGKFIFPQKRPKACEYLELIALEGKLSDEEDRLTFAEERFKERLRAQRQKFVELGRRQAKKILKKIDPTFSAKGIDPQDVKVIFDPTRLRPPMSEVDRLLADTSRMKEMTGWEPSVSLEDGLRKTVDWISDHFLLYRPDVYAI